MRPIDDRERERRLKELKERSSTAFFWYYLLGAVFVLVAIAIFVATFHTAVTTASYWNDLDAKTKLPDAYAPATRGNIYSDEGTALAISVPMYQVYIDFRAAGFRDTTFLNNVDGLSAALAEYFGNKSKDAYKRDLMSAFKSRGTKKIYRIIPYEISHTQLKAMRQMPYLSIPNRNKSGLVYDMAIRREKPFNTMASRTIGFLHKDVDSMNITHGSSGLEMAFDSLLCGVPGIDMQRYISGAWIRRPKKKPIDGMDVHTTINVAIQDITERSLRDMLVEVDADWGCAVVMEVETGAIKALSNLDRKTIGVYAESTNHALADLLEPGSTFKVPSIMAALEEGSASPEDSVETGNGLFPYAKRIVRDHNAHKGGYGRITVAEAIHYSSNVGVVKTILKGFENDKKKFLHYLDEMSFFEPINLEIPGTATARIQRDTDKWAKTSLPWISFGYETMVPPIYTCRFYNAIANNGKMMEPYLVTHIKDKDKVVMKKKPVVVNSRIASDKTLRQMKEMLRGVVTDGTATEANSEHIEIAGKTGTAQRSAGAAGYEGQGHNVSFCGFFPYDKPKYTCIVVVSRPRNGYPSGGRIAGGVVRNIAEQIFATTMSMPIGDVVPDSAAHFNFAIHGGSRAAVKAASDITGISPHDIDGRGKWLAVDSKSGEDGAPRALNDFLAFDPEVGVVPSLVGLSPVDAVFLAEKVGLKVSLSGYGGRVVGQSLPAGRKVSGREHITIRIK